MTANHHNQHLAPVFLRVLGAFSWFLYAVATITLALGVTWSLYAKINYSYPFWYQALNIDEHIDHYGPLNRHHKPDLQNLKAEQHQALFSAITVAVHDDGQGLEAIQYHDRQGRLIDLLRPAEVEHLQDVARLMNLGQWAWAIALIAWLPLALGVKAQRQLNGRHRVLVAGTPLLAMVVWLLISGPEAVFYQFHIWLFPADHEWFFYWQDSLMSTLMKAPVLFGGIAVVLLGGTVALTPLFYRGGLWLSQYLHRDQPNN